MQNHTHFHTGYFPKLALGQLELELELELGQSNTELISSSELFSIARQILINAQPHNMNAETLTIIQMMTTAWSSRMVVGGGTETYLWDAQNGA